MCNGEVVTPFDDDIRCPICDEEFNEIDREHHEQEPDVVNALVPSIEELQYELDNDDGNKGCIVVCNLTENDVIQGIRDIRRQRIQNGMEPLPERNETELTNYITKTQCEHRRHFLHRVCYSIHLLYYKSTISYYCPLTRVRFYDDLPPQ